MQPALHEAGARAHRHSPACRTSRATAGCAASRTPPPAPPAHRRPPCAPPRLGPPPAHDSDDSWSAQRAWVVQTRAHGQPCATSARACNSLCIIATKDSRNTVCAGARAGDAATTLFDDIQGDITYANASQWLQVLNAGFGTRWDVNWFVAWSVKRTASPCTAVSPVNCLKRICAACGGTASPSGVDVNNLFTCTGAGSGLSRERSACHSVRGPSVAAALLSLQAQKVRQTGCAVVGR